MTKSELIEKISESLKLPAGKAEAIVNCVFDSMVKALERGEGIEIRGFGSFTVREYKAYEGRNPRTGEHLLPLYVALGAGGENPKANRLHAGIDDYVIAMDAFSFLAKKGG